MKILYLGAEAMPFVQAGGLGDVLFALPSAIAKIKGADVRVMLPLYDTVKRAYGEQLELAAEGRLALAWRQLDFAVYSIRRGNLLFYFIENDYYFGRENIYGYPDDGERFAFFSMAALRALPLLSFFPDILHANDWHSALVLPYLKAHFCGLTEYASIRTVFTIHNIAFQGIFPMEQMWDIFALPQEYYATVEQNGNLNLMKAAILLADRVTTVSPTYAAEIQTPAYGSGLEDVLKSCAHKLSGILNGIDCDYYNPDGDSALLCPYHCYSHTKKRENKLFLQEELSLRQNADTPLLAVISRISEQKGLSLLFSALTRLLDAENVQFVLLGRGDPSLEQLYLTLEQKFPTRVKIILAYNRVLAKRIYGSADIFCMPSKTEPCGLSQMIACRYGSIPIVRKTGGLADSIRPYGTEGGNGFVFEGEEPSALYEQIKQALALMKDPIAHMRFVSRIMRCDFSFATSAACYLSLYEEIFS